MNRLRSALAALLLAVTAALIGTPAARAAAAAPAAAPHDVIVHLFAWPWASVATECTTVLGPAGYGAVQVSPPQEHVVLPGKGYPWWQDYQPVSYQLASRRGDRAGFAAMVAACRAAGVKVYVDVVVNHMAGGASTGPGSAGSAFSHYGYPAVPYGSGDFHHCGRNGTDDIVDYDDRYEVQNCELVDLSDLDTGSAYVRGRLVAYLNDLLSLGVGGFRVDAAKHVPAADLAAIRAGLTGAPYVFQETIEGGGVSPAEYTAIGDVTEFRYGDVVGSAFRDGNLGALAGLADRMLVASDDAVAFIDNHDTQRNGRAALTYRDGSAYALAEAFMLAFPYGTPSVMSSFTFADPEAGPPATAGGTTTAVTCGSGWACEHRWRTTANLVALRNTAAGTAVTNWWTNGSDQIAFGRGAAAYTVFNRGRAPLSRTFQTSLPAGTYCDVAAGDFRGGTCTGPVRSVDSGGRVTLTVPPGGMAALHTGARPAGDTCATVTVQFAAQASTVWGENVLVLGDRAELGSWQAAGGLRLSAATYPVWRGAVTLPAGTAVAYKYVKVNGSAVTWESGGNRTLRTGSNCTLSVTDEWRS